MLLFTGGASPTPCLPGTFNPDVGSPAATSCQACTSGRTCSRAGLTAPDLPCAAGHYCPGGNSLVTEYPCLAGTYTDWDNLTASDQCIDCPQSWACLSGTGGVQNPPVPCAVGHFCPAATPAPDHTDCPPGTWTNQTNLYRVEDCYACPKGQWCQGGQPAPDGDCAAGHWCPISK